GGGGAVNWPESGGGRVRGAGNAASLHARSPGKDIGIKALTGARPDSAGSGARSPVCVRRIRASRKLGLLPLPPAGEGWGRGGRKTTYHCCCTLRLPPADVGVYRISPAP